MQATRNAHRPIFFSPAIWLRRVLAVAALAALAGCAGMNGSPDAMINAEEMAAHSDDPIGALIAAQYARDALHGHSHHPILSEALEQLGTPYRFGGDSL